MLECEPTPDHIITLPEMNSEELESLLEFLYSGSLALDKMGKHVRSLFQAAHKYEISYLQECCKHYILDSLNVSNVLVALEMSDVFSSQIIKDIAMKFIVEKMVEITVSAEYEAFADKNPHLSLQITRAIVYRAKDYVSKKSFTSELEYRSSDRYSNSGWTADGWKTGSWDPWPN